MPLQVARLRDSDLAAEEHPEACWYAVLLWAASWHQIPAASLPDNDTVLMKLCGLGRDIKTWSKHRDGALRGFIKCDDGRLYHPVVVEQALAAWDGKIEQRWRTECARIKKHNQRHSASVVAPSLDEFKAAGCVAVALDKRQSSPGTNGVSPDGHGNLSLGTDGVCPPGNTLQEKGKGKEEKKEEPPEPPRKRVGREGKHLLPKDWQVPSIGELPPQARKCAQLWEADAYPRHAEAFVNYWRSEGKMKTDWNATWANRVVALHDQVMRSQRFAGPATPPGRDLYSSIERIPPRNGGPH